MKDYPKNSSRRFLEESIEDLQRITIKWFPEKSLEKFLERFPKEIVEKVQKKFVDVYLNPRRNFCRIPWNTFLRKSLNDVLKTILWKILEETLDDFLKKKYSGGILQQIPGLFSKEVSEIF